ncbi:BnaA09g29610D [Brassica napus]|uniref:BnaA09g29610D protein n=1 Tax=Brassica napus TaxID=3708 RepID=A0A078FTQ1_BRANA|nr:BnaA09g29610D [Brassica napus]
MEAAVLSKPHRLKYDFFLSFRGEDTRHTVVKRLYDALHVKEKALIFRDNEGMERGQAIYSSLVAGIEDSAASLVVFSPRYADSHWCLDELATLCDVSSSLDRPMIPIFYKVDPSHVRKQSGRFVEDFETHAEKFKDKEIEIQRWRGAMKIVGNLPGFIYREGEKEDEMIGLVVKRVLAEENNTPEKVGEYTVGLESRVDDLMNLVNVKILGLYGMGGIGKTTLAKAFYNKIVDNFKEQRVFISNVRERSSGQDGLVNLQKTFISELFGLVPEIEDVNQGRDKIRESVHEKKILVVLDDVDNVDQVDTLIGERSWYGEGTLIVITTRDEEILNRLSVSGQKYEVSCLSKEQALKLFSYHSLRKDKPPGSLLQLSEKIVETTGFLPLAVEVFGSLLYDKKEEKEWLVQLEKLKSTKLHNLQGVLKVSIESLDDEEKKVFLDTACLFLKMDMTKEEIVDVLKGCGFNAEAVLKALRQKSLVKFLADNTLWMHDQIKDMGMQMVVKESPEDPGKRSRLWDRGEIMNNMKGTPSIRGIVLNFKKKSMRLDDDPGTSSILKPTSTENTIPVEHFVPMKKLRLLQINHVELQGNLELLPSDLKWIQWRGCPLKDVPASFLSRQLAVLDLSESGIRRFQSFQPKIVGLQVEGNLKVVNLRGCDSLEAIPDLSNHKSLEKLVFEGCKLLVEVPSSVGNLRSLLHLDLRNCPNLTEFLVDVSGLKSLEKLYLSGCSSLSVLPENIGYMLCLKELLLDETAIKNLPGSIFRLEKLQKLSLKSCRSIHELPECIGTLTSLEELDLSSTSLQSLPSSIGNLKNLQKLHVMHCASLSKIPDTINKLASLQELIIDGSAVEELPLSLKPESLSKIPDTINKLASLQELIIDGSAVEELPLSLKPVSLPCLAKFSAGGCKSLKQVPSSVGWLNSLLQLKLDSTPITTLPEEISQLRFIQKVELRNCLSLKSLPNKIGDMDTLHSLYLEGSNIEELPENFGNLENLVLLQMNKCKNLKKLPNSFGGLKSLCHLYMEETLVMELPESFGNLSNLRILNLGNNKFHSLPSSFKGLSSLKELSLCDCQELTCVPPLPCNLEKLNLANCCSLESISDLSELTMLHELNLTNCGKVDDIPGLEHLTALKRLHMSGCNFQVHR